MAHYLLLVSLSKENRPSAQRLGDNVIKNIDRNAKPLWFDSAHVGMAMTTDLYAAQIWPIALKGAEDLRDILILQLGRDWCGVRDMKNSGWLNSHLGPPLYPGAPR